MNPNIDLTDFPAAEHNGQTRKAERTKKDTVQLNPIAPCQQTPGQPALKRPGMPGYPRAQRIMYIYIHTVEWCRMNNSGFGEMQRPMQGASSPIQRIQPCYRKDFTVEFNHAIFRAWKLFFRRWWRLGKGSFRKIWFFSSAGHHAQQHHRLEGHQGHGRHLLLWLLRYQQSRPPGRAQINRVSNCI